MSNIVAEMSGMGVDDDDIRRNLGMDADEVLRLKQNSGMAELFKDVDFSEVSFTISYTLKSRYYKLINKHFNLKDIKS